MAFYWSPILLEYVKNGIPGQVLGYSPLESPMAPKRAQLWVEGRGMLGHESSLLSSASPRPPFGWDSIHLEPSGPWPVRGLIWWLYCLPEAGVFVSAPQLFLVDIAPSIENKKSLSSSDGSREKPSVTKRLRSQKANKNNSKCHFFVVFPK